MRFASLGSGSAGNALIVESGETRLMLDCGFGLRETAARLARLGLVPDQISGILVTHEHDDHASGAFRFAARHGIPVWTTHGTLQAAQRHQPKHCPTPPEIIDSHTPFAIGTLMVHPFPVPHDAREPVQFVFHDGNHKLGVLTDTGTSTPHIEAMLNGCHALVLECNHDRAMLMAGPYPPSLKQRVSGRFGHLDNATAAELLATLDNGKLQHIVAAHLSAKNNTPHLATSALAGVLGCGVDWIGVAEQATGLDWRQIG